MDDVTLYCGECAEVMAREIADGSIDLTVTSPPYDNLRTYKGFIFDFEAIAAQLWRVTKTGGVVVWVVADATINGSETGTSFRQALHFMGLGFNLHDTMIWSKPNFAGVGALQCRYAPTFEFMFIFSKGSPVTFNPIKDRRCFTAGSQKSGTIRNADGSMKRMSNEGRTQQEFGQRFNVWQINPKTTNGHPAPFPEALARDHIVSWSNPGDVVLDPMCGSGTTLKMAVLAGRRAIGIDVAAEYVELTQKRIAAAQLQAPLFPAAALQPARQGELFADAQP